MAEDRSVERNFKKYLIVRQCLYWVMLVIFIGMAPVIMLFSLGYKFDAVKGFVKTGALLLKTFPDGATVYVNGKMSTGTTPMSIRYVLPNTYSIRIEKEGYYPYAIESVVEAAKVSEVSAVLISVVSEFDAVGKEFEVYNYFISKKVLGPKVILFTSDGIYVADGKLADTKKLSQNGLSKNDGQSIKGLLEVNGFLVFWNEHIIYKFALSRDEEQLSEVEQIYSTDKDIQSVYSGMKDRYLIVHAGEKILAVDIVNNLNIITLVELKHKKASVMYDEQQEALFFTDYDPERNATELYTTELRTTFMGRLEGITNEYNKAKKNS